MIFRLLFISWLCFSALVTWAKEKPVEIILWHSFAGQLGHEVQQLVSRFNKSQEEYQVKPVYKGDYLETLTSFAAAFRAKQPPALVQVFEVGMPTMLSPRGIIKPLHELMAEQKMNLPLESFYPAIRTYYSENGHLKAMPFNSSVPVIFYNADALAKAGYSNQPFPKTWEELELLAADLRKAGYPCAFTSAHPAWVLIESFAAIHGLPMLTEDNTQAVYNQKPMIEHLERLLRWQQAHYFEYGGRGDDPTILFTSGRCPLFSQSSGGYNSLKSMVSFPMGIAPLPLDQKISPVRFNNVTGGAALWAVAGHSSAVYQGVAAFFVFLAKPDVQQTWHNNTGYLPLGVNGVYKSLAQGSQHPSLALAQMEFTAVPRPPLRIQMQIRRINDEALEGIFAGLKSPKAALDEAVARATHASVRFRRNTTIE
ncbi:extracellular solute-binding protein [Legionella sp. 27cVA30]|uniref:sn-glycerol-3-phosphate-binding periplasmic protein UgpB n=1 Tax=Legionella septentrionalis TaxID=2498109 RepID=A0A3S0V5Z7_9GAMM|nr:MULTISPECIES: extracellular solute-binding protein [Legionella]MCP0914459.1 extracellular solute-binding protein [Legionella sp. 27cVA30]RUQ89477.1 extracellular solute-binding protein [Legionella septentrionalis]RUR16109.1 extracellular solute-binding protein [Legionella septentrionalis]